MRSRQNTGTNGNRTNRTGIASINTRFAVQNLRTDDPGLQIEQDIADFNGIRCRFSPALRLFRQSLVHSFINMAQLARTRLFLADLVSFAQFRFRNPGNGGDQFLVFGRWFPFHFRFAAIAHQLVNGIDNHFHLFMAEYDSAQHDVLRQLFRFGLYHQDGLFCSCHNQIKLRQRQLRSGWIQHILSVNIAYPGGTQRSIERNPGNAQSGGCCNHGRNIRIDFRIDRQNVNDDLNLVEVTVREKRTNRTINQA